MSTKNKTEPKQNFLEKLFGGINLTWPRLIIASIIIGVFVGLLMLIPAFKDTSITRIGVILYWWVFFGVIIITNSKNNLDSALKCFVFFLISQPVIYLVQVPFSYLGFGLFGYWVNTWLWWTLATLPMGFIGYWIKRKDVWAAVILAPALAVVGLEGYGEFTTAFQHFPQYLLSGIFCVAILVALLMGVLDKWTMRGLSIVVAAIVTGIFLAFYAVGPEDINFSFTYGVKEYGVTTEKEWIVESNFGDRATLDISDIYNEDGEKTGETVYYFAVRGNGNDFGTHQITLKSDDEVKNCIFDVKLSGRTIVDDFHCE